MQWPRTIGYPNEVRQFDSFFFSSLPFVTGRGVVRALSLRARRPVSGFTPCIWNPSPGQSDISGDPSGWFSGASDRSGSIASQHATARIAISSKLKDLCANRVVPRGLARMLQRFLQKQLSAKSDSSRTDVRGRSDASQTSTHHLAPRAISPAWHCARLRTAAERNEC
jgi:hypothetical protein